MTPIRIAVSFGGTKIAVGVIRSGCCTLISRSDRIEWRDDPHWVREAPLVSLLEIVAHLSRSLLEKAILPIDAIELIGIAWPGPGRYAEGLLNATFIPGCETVRNIHQLILDTFRKELGVPLASVRIVSRLDVNARAIGETCLGCGAFSVSEGVPEPNGIVLNIATGIAGAIVREGHVLPEFEPWGETYGQWGRYLFKDRTTGEWSWRPTLDGSVPQYDEAREIRFTELCGGPALTRRFATFARLYASSDLDPLPASLVSFESIACHPRANLRDLKAERELLIQITREAYRENPLDLKEPSGLERAFVQEVGADIGGALQCLFLTLGRGTLGQKVVLAGGVGENFGAPPVGSGAPDLLLNEIMTALVPFSVAFARSKAGLDAELVAFAVD